MKEDKRNYSLYSMSKRLGIFATPPPKIRLPKDKHGHPVDIVDLDGLDHMKALLENQGGHLQQERMIYDKRRTLDRAVLYSYQGALIVKDRFDGMEHKRPFHALINPNKNKPDYDEKILSVGFEYGIKPGDTFEWKNTKTHWLVYLQDLTELAYFRGNIRRCSYEIEWLDDDEIKKTYVAVRGPVETQINFIQKHQISVDEPNHSLNIIMPRNEDTLKYFRRYSKFYLKGVDEGSPTICWRVEATDWISTPGILEITAEEYYANQEEDDVENGIAGGLIVHPMDPDPMNDIIGDFLIKARLPYDYIYEGQEEGEWKVDSNFPVEMIVDEENDKKITVKWKSNVSGSFMLSYGEVSKIIRVESLF